MSIEAYIRDVTNHSHQICGKLFAGDFTQIVKQNHDGNNLSLMHSFYSIDDDGVVKQLGGMSFSEDAEGSISLNLSVNDDSGESRSVMALSPNGMSVSGGIDVVGGSTNFETTSIAVADYDINLGSVATDFSDLDGGGIILGTEESGTITLTYSLDSNSWMSNAGFNIDTGLSFTVNNDSVILDEDGLKISNTNLSQSGLSIGEHVVLNEEGLVVGDSLSLSTTDGLRAGDISLDSSNGLIVGESIALNDTGLYIGDDISISKTGGLVLGMGTDGTVLDDLSLKFGQDLLLNHDGLYFSNAAAAVYMGPSNQWKISFNSESENLRFEYFDQDTASYVVKMELKSSSSV